MDNLNCSHVKFWVAFITATYLLSRPAGQRALELEESATDLVSHGGMALLVHYGLAAAEETATRCRGSGRGVVGAVSAVAAGRGRGGGLVMATTEHFEFGFM